MTSDLQVAAVQLTSTADVDSNLQRAAQITQQAAAAGARFIVLPENFGFLGIEEGATLSYAQHIDGPFTSELRRIARQYSAVILAGSIPEKSSDPRRIYNTSVVIGADGSTLATYRKIHLFDVTLSPHLQLIESDTVMPGDAPVLVDVLTWPVGLSICYDLRFPEMYRALVRSGARILTVPAAFTLQTGKDHWEPLLRARAIENQSFVIAAAQFGFHGGRRTSWGKSMIIDPWGTCLAVAPEREGFITATLHNADLEKIRRALPALEHRKL